MEKKAAEVVKLLIEKGWYISFAESCTGGLASAALVGVPDASKVLKLALVTYANEAKRDMLKVSGQDLDTYGAVSRQVAGQMARGAAALAGAQAAVGISGIAGPGGGSPEKPVGTVCFGFYIDGQLTTCTEHFGDLGRNKVRQACVEFVYDRLLQLLPR